MRSDIVPGGVFPDYELPDHTERPRKLSEIQGDDPLILTLARGHYCPRSTSSTAARRVLSEDRRRLHADRDDRHRRAPHDPGVPPAVGAQWPFLSDPERIVQKDLDIQEYTDPENDPMIPHTLVLKPGLVIHSIYNGYWYWGRPSTVGAAARPARRHARDPARLGPRHARACARRGTPATTRPSTAGTSAPSRCGERRVDVVVDPRRGELPARTPDVDGDAGLRRQLGRAPAHDVVLQRARAPVVDRPRSARAGCRRRSRTAARRTRAARPARGGRSRRRPARGRSRRARTPQGRRRRRLPQGRAGSPDDVCAAQLRVGLEQRRADRVAAGQRPAARSTRRSSSSRASGRWSATIATGSSTRPASPSRWRTTSSKPRARRTTRATSSTVTLRSREPRAHLGDERLERPRAPDPPAYRVVQLGLAGERLDQRIDLARHQPVEVRHDARDLAAPLVLHVAAASGAENSSGAHGMP